MCKLPNVLEPFDYFLAITELRQNQNHCMFVCNILFLIVHNENALFAFVQIQIRV